MKCANFNKIQPIAPDVGAHPKASYLKYAETCIAGRRNLFDVTVYSLLS